MYFTDDINSTYTSYMCVLAVNDLNMFTDTPGINSAMNTSPSLPRQPDCLPILLKLSVYLASN